MCVCCTVAVANKLQQPSAHLERVVGQINHFVQHSFLIRFASTDSSQSAVNGSKVDRKAEVLWVLAGYHS